jgi:hypothetical protein
VNDVTNPQTTSTEHSFPIIDTADNVLQAKLAKK